MSDQVMASDCEHAYVTRVRGGEPVSVRACSLCGQPDWPDLREQVERLVEEARPAARRTVWMVETDGAHGRCIFDDRADANTYAALVRATAREPMLMFSAGMAPMTWEVWHATASVGAHFGGQRVAPRVWSDHRSELSGGTPACVVSLDNYNGTMVVVADGTDRAAVEAAVADRYAKLCAAFEAPDGDPRKATT